MLAPIADHAVIKVGAVVELVKCDRLGAGHGLDCSTNKCYMPAAQQGVIGRREWSFLPQKRHALRLQMIFPSTIYTHIIFMFTNMTTYHCFFIFLLFFY